MKTLPVAFTALILLLIPNSTASTSAELPLPNAHVEPVSAELEIEFIPDATVTVVDSEIEVAFVADGRDVVCGEYTCTFTPIETIALRAER